MIITEHVEINISPRNVEYYENLGYRINKIVGSKGKLVCPKGTTLMVNIKDLSKASGVKVNVKCDGCGDILKNIAWSDYTKQVHKDNTYYCNVCATKLYAGKRAMKSKLENGGKSLEDWCNENGRKDLIDRWDEKLNKYKISEINCRTAKKYYFKCPMGIHPSEKKHIASFTFDKGSMNCKACNSFAQWGIDNICEDFLDKYWSIKNTISPWEIDYCGSNNPIYIKCQDKDYHDDYKSSPCIFNKGCRCPGCSHKVGHLHILDSLGTLFPQVLELWSDRNKKSPYEYSPMNNNKIYWKCPCGKHGEHFTKIYDANKCDFRCPECTQERNESLLQEKVRLYLNTFDYTILHEHRCTIVPINPKRKGTNNTLPFDNEVLELKLLCEVMGQQHYRINGYHIMQAKTKNTTPKQELHYTKLKDRYKRIYSKSKGYNYLEISYKADNKRETYKLLIDNKIEQILKQQLNNNLVLQEAI